MEKHVTAVAVLNIAFGALGILVAIIVFLAVVGGGLISRDAEAMAITAVVGTIVASFLIVLSIPEIIGGFGLLKRRSWARILVLVIAFLDLLNIPFGTVIGIYTIWVLLNEETVQLFAAKKLEVKP
jgi:hypothetical protein